MKKGRLARPFFVWVVYYADMSRMSLVVPLSAAQILIIYVLSAQALEARYSYTVTPIYGSDIEVATTSDRFKHYYDLSSENRVFVPDWLPYTPLYERNRDRLNDRFDYERPKPSGHYRILTLGDSWTFGMHVHTADNFSEQLEDLLNGALRRGTLSCRGIRTFDVINLGLGGYDITYMVESLRLRGMPYEPDLVIPFVKNDDFVVVNEIWKPKIAAYQDAYGPLDATVVGGVAINPREEIAARVMREINAKYDTQELEEMSMRELEFMDTFYRGPVLFFIYGMPEKQEERMFAYAKERPLSYVHREVILASDEKVPHDEHPGASGHRRFASGLYAAMVEQGIIPCDER